MLTDSHAHIHFDEYSEDLEQIFYRAQENNIRTIITVGTDPEGSLRAINFVLNPDYQTLAGDISLFATAGIHPHEANRGELAFAQIKDMISNNKYQTKLVAIGECGLDYYKNLSSKSEQILMLEWQLQLAQDNDLPVVFHVRDAWDDFFAIIKNYPNMRGVIHSFTGYPEHLKQASEHQLYFGLNGIMTFTRDTNQLEAAKQIPIERLLLETDCPYLSPAPYRGKRNEPSYLRSTAQFLADLRNEKFDALALNSTKNAQELFGL